MLKTVNINRKISDRKKIFLKNFKEEIFDILPELDDFFVQCLGCSTESCDKNNAFFCPAFCKNCKNDITICILKSDLKKIESFKIKN